MSQIVIAGAGPAGWSLASACARLGLTTVVVAPSRRWPATYGMWLDEVSVLPEGARYVTARARAGERWLSRRYVVLDNDSVVAGFAHPGVTTVSGRVRSLVPGGVRLGDGTVVRGRVVVDATGAGPRRGPRIEQSAYGLIVSAAAAAPFVGAGEAVFMDWRDDTFLYAVPRPDGRVLLEETSLARRPGLDMATLRDRLHARLAAHGVPTTGDVERVRFALDVPPPPASRGAVPFGAAAGLVHPATGFSLADTFRLAPLVAAVIHRDLDRGPARINRSVRRVLWPPAARLTYALRRAGLATLLTLSPGEHEEFFDLFFALPDHRQRAYLSARTDLRGTVATMAALFRAAPTHLRLRMVRR